MSFLELAQNRYTTKKYDSSEKIPDGKIEQLKEILRLSPSSINSQPWRFSFVSNPEIKSKLAAVSYFNEPKINDASHLVVFSSLDSVSDFEKQIHEHLPEGSVSYYNHFIKPGTDEEIKAWMQHQVYLSLGFFLSATASIGIDSTPMEGIQSDKYREILGLTNYKPLFAVALGYRNPEDGNQPTIKSKSRFPMEMILDCI